MGNYRDWEMNQVETFALLLQLGLGHEAVHFRDKNQAWFERAAEERSQRGLLEGTPMEEGQLKESPARREALKHLEIESPFPGQGPTSLPTGRAPVLSYLLPSEGHMDRDPATPEITLLVLSSHDFIMSLSVGTSHVTPAPRARVDWEGFSFLLQQWIWQERKHGFYRCSPR